jgi:hypothetical protein
LVVCIYLANAELDDVGLKLQVEEERLRDGIDVLSADDATTLAGGDVLFEELKISVSLIVAKDNGERTTEPGVILGSSSMLFI